MKKFGKSLLILVLISSGLLSVVAPATVNVTTPYGVILGTTISTSNGHQMQAFVSVPYAESPPMRFAPPNRLTKLNPNPYNAAISKPDCARWGLDSKTMDPVSSEDCLYVKILTPLTFKCCLPVMFWIQGGGFNDGSYNDYDDDAIGDNFISKNVIVVQVNHRQGALGFFTTGTPEAPGNWGVWDVLQALDFVYHNIKAFGGDKYKITIMGQESGAVMADVLSLVPKARSMFSGVILIGGSVFDPVITRNDDLSVARSQDIAYRVGCDNEKLDLWNKNPEKLMDCMRYNVTTEKMVSAIGRADIIPEMAGTILCNYYWRPRHDGYYGILSNSFEHLALNRPRIPVMMGCMNRDWLSELLPFIFDGSDSLPQNFNATYNIPKFAKETCENLLSESLYDPSTFKNLTQQCIKNYVNNSNVDSPYYWVHRAARIATGYHVMGPLYKTANFLRQQNNRNVYLYSFEYDRRTVNEFWKATGGSRYLDIALLENVNPVFEFNNNDYQIMDLFSDLLTNFAKYRNPTPSSYTKIEEPWRTCGLDNKYMVIDTTCKMEEDFYTDDSEFWIQNGALDEDFYYVHPNADMYDWGYLLT